MSRASAVGSGTVGRLTTARKAARQALRAVYALLLSGDGADTRRSYSPIRVKHTIHGFYLIAEQLEGTQELVNGQRVETGLIRQSEGTWTLFAAHGQGAH